MRNLSIFITVGSTKFKFDRVFSCLDKILTESNGQYFMTVQTGSSKYRWTYKKIKTYDYLDPKTMTDYIKESGKIITHGGPISIFQIAKYAKNMPLIIPRLSKFKEHVDNHQYFFAQYMQKKLPPGLKKYFLLEDDIEPGLEKYLFERPERNMLNKFLFDKQKTEHVVHKIASFLKTNYENSANV